MPVYGFDEKGAKRIARVVRAYEKGGGGQRPPQARTPYWPAPWDVGDGNEDVDLRPASDTQTTARTTTWNLGDGTWVTRHYRIIWNAAALKIQGAYWDARYDAYGRTVAVSGETIYDLLNLTTIAGYNGAATQVLTHVSGTLTWLNTDVC